MLRSILSLLLLLSAFASHATSLDQLQQAMEQQEYATAAQSGASLLKSQPENAHIRFLTALALQRSNQVQQAEQHYLQLIRNHPELPEPRNNLAMIYLERGLHDEAAGLLIASLKTHPSYATAWKNLSDLYKGLASEAYRKALGEEKPGSALDNIQLSAIDQLHSLPLEIATPVIRIARVESPSPPDNVSPQKDSSENAVAPQPVAESVKPAASVIESQSPIQALQLWAEAWSNKAINDYIDAYTADYKGAQISRQKWLAFRESRINRPGDISITLSNIKIRSQSSARATVDAQQSYQSPSYQDKVVKRFNLTKINGKWKISRERTLAVL